MDDTTRPHGIARPEERDVLPGELIADWRCVKPLARGGFGVVYAVEHVQTGEPAALKLLHAHLAASSETLARFGREIRVIGELQHPNIVRLVDAGFSSDGRPFLCMEKLEGDDLSSVIERSGRLPVERMVAILTQVCDAVSLAHERGIIHRDIKSSNIMLCAGDRVVLLDFGIAKISDALGPELTATNQSLGTPSCMAPEQIHGLRPDARTDIYALGGLVFHILTGRMAFQDPSATMMQYLHLHARRPRASLVQPDISEEIDAVITRAMQIAPADRYASVAAFATALTSAAGHPVSAGSPTTQIDTLAILVTVADRTAGAAFDAALCDDLESVLLITERLLVEHGFTLAADLGSSALFVARTETVCDATAVGSAVVDKLAERPRRDPRVQIGVFVHRDMAPYIDDTIQPCALLRPGSWHAPDGHQGLWISPSVAER